MPPSIGRGGAGGELCGTQDHSPIADRRPGEATFFQPFGDHDHAAAIPGDQPQAVRALRAEDEDIPAVRISAQRLGHKCYQTMHALAKVYRARSQQDLQARMQRDHAPDRTAAKTVRNATASTAPLSRIRTPSTSISIVPATEICGAASAGSPAILIGTNCSSSRHPLSRARRRQ